MQDQYFREGHGAALGTGDVAALAHKPAPLAPQVAPVPPPTPAPQRIRTGLTVGSLIGQPLV
ncbi:hypothetical protein D3C86_1945840 [compost metagenome]